MRFPPVTIALPEWVESFAGDPARTFGTVPEQMEFVIELSRLNVENGTGGPFGAAVFDSRSHRLLAPGVNLVVPSVCSVAHAEIVAIAVAQQLAGRYDLGSDSLLSCELVTSTEPCAMCLGAIPWSGVHRIVCGARKEDAMQIGFDEGPRPSDWIEQLEARGVAVLRDVGRQEAVAVLRKYCEEKRPIYNGRQGIIPR